VIATDERYIMMKSGKMFSTGNHPVKTMLPILHMNNVGFDIDIATLSGNPVKFEMWAMPLEDESVIHFYQKYLSQFKKPLKHFQCIRT
jgi:molecular chaperone Hsp31 and glyoxalase 3